MLITRTTLKSAAAALLMTAALTGCGDSSDDEVGAVPATSATTPESTTPVLEAAPAADPTKKVGKKEGAWAERLCTALVGRVESIQPPSVAASTPAATLTSLTVFFKSVVTEQGSQLKVLEDVGPPPAADAKKEWEAAVAKLRSVRSDVTGVVDGLEETKATSEADVTKLIASLQKQLASLGSYSGPVKDLFASKAVGNALLSDPACEKVS